MHACVHVSQIKELSSKIQIAVYFYSLTTRSNSSQVTLDVRVYW